MAKLLDNHLPSWKLDVLESWTWSHEFGSWKIARCGNFVHLCNVAPRGFGWTNGENGGRNRCSETLAQLYPSDKKNTI